MSKGVYERGGREGSQAELMHTGVRGGVRSRMRA